MRVVPWMYLLALPIGWASYHVTRGPDGELMQFFVLFGALAVIFVALAWAARRTPMWWHLGGQALCFGLAAWLGLRPPPHLDGMAGMLYLFVPAALVAMLLLAAMTRLVGWWLARRA